MSLFRYVVVLICLQGCAERLYGVQRQEGLRDAEGSPMTYARSGQDSGGERPKWLNINEAVIWSASSGIICNLYYCRGACSAISRPLFLSI